MADFTAPDLTLMAPEDYEPIQHDARLALAHAVDHGLPMTDARHIGQALGLIDSPYDHPRGHVKGLRAVPADWTRRGAVAG